MLIHVILENKEICEGCPCCGIDNGENETCYMGYWESSDMEQGFFNKETKVFLTPDQYHDPSESGEGFDYAIKRPQACIDRYGE